MKNLFLIIFLINFNACAEFVSLKYPSGTISQRIKLVNGKPEVIVLEAGESIDSLIMHGEGNYRVIQEIETSVTVMDEGPHIDLIDWKHGVSEPLQLKNKGNEFFFIDQSESIKFPKVDLSELIEVVRKKAGERWAKIAKKCKSPETDPCAVAPSKIIFKVQKEQDKDSFIDLGIIELIPAMGC